MSTSVAAPIVQPPHTPLSANQIAQQHFDRIADRFGLDRGILVVPDVLANAGGVTASYFEQVQSNTGHFWSREDLISTLGAWMTRAFRKVLETSQRERVALRDPTYPDRRQTRRGGKQAQGVGVT